MGTGVYMDKGGNIRGHLVDSLGMADLGVGLGLDRAMQRPEDGRECGCREGSRCRL